MMGDRTKAWLISLLSAETALTSLLTDGSKAVLSAEQNYPSDEGVYIQIVTDVPATFRGFARADVRIYAVKVGEQECWNLINMITDNVYKPPGSPGAWGVLPSTVGLSVKATTEPQVVVAPEQIDINKTYSGVLAFTVIGRDLARPA